MTVMDHSVQRQQRVKTALMTADSRPSDLNAQQAPELTPTLNTGKAAAVWMGKIHIAGLDQEGTCYILNQSCL